MFATQLLICVLVFPLFLTNEVIRARMDDHYELEGDKVLYVNVLLLIGNIFFPSFLNVFLDHESL